MGDRGMNQDMAQIMARMNLHHTNPDHPYQNHINGGMNMENPNIQNDVSPNKMRLWEKDLEDEGVFRLRKKSVRFPHAKYFCRLCEYHCDNIPICWKHVNDTRHSANKEMTMLDISLEKLPKPNQAHLEVLTELITATAAKCKLTDTQRSANETIRHDLESKMSESIPDIKVLINGSALSGFALKSSNLDLDILIPDGVKTTTVFQTIVKVAQEYPSYSQLEKNLNASFPSVTFLHKETQTAIEMRIHSKLSMETNTLLSQYIKLDPRVEIIVLAFRQWARLAAIDDQRQGTLPAHCFPLMALHFLQHSNPPVVPCLHDLVPRKSEDVYARPEDISPPWQSDNTQSVGELWVELLRFYAVSLNMTHRVVNVRWYRAVSRGEKTWGKRMFIEDPFQPKRNLTRSVTNNAVYEFINDVLKLSFRYFAVPQMKYGMLFKAVGEPGGSLFKSRMVEKKEPQHQNKGDSDDEEDSKDSANGDITEDSSNGTDTAAAAAEKSKVHLIAWDKLNRWPKPTTEDTCSGLASLKLDSLVSTVEKVPFELAERLVYLVQKEDLVFRFFGPNFTEGNRPPLQCSTCFSLGHSKANCREYELPKLIDLPNLRHNYFKILTSVLTELKSQCEPTESGVVERNDLVEELEHCLREIYPDTSLHLFGSSANGFGFDKSDVDICITFDSVNGVEELDQVAIIEKIADRLKNFNVCKNVLAITTARVPIVKFYHKRSRLEVDLSLYNTLALRNTKLLNTYASIDTRVKELGYIMKFFAKLCDIGDASRGSLSSYAYILMVIHYLQQCSPPVVPVLQELYDKDTENPEFLVDGWNSWFHCDAKQLAKKWKGHKKNSDSLGQLWLGLICYYTETFDWESNVVSIRQFEPLNRLEKMWTTNCIAIEDPFVLSHNLGGGLSRKMSTYIMKSLIKAREVFGVGRESSYGSRSLEDTLFNPTILTDGLPPNDRGCRCCGKIGHRVKDCPRKKLYKEKKDKKRRNKTNKEDNLNDTQLMEEPSPEGSPVKSANLEANIQLKQLDKGILRVYLEVDNIDFLEPFVNDIRMRGLFTSLGYRFYSVLPIALPQGSIVYVFPCDIAQQSLFLVRSPKGLPDLTAYLDNIECVIDSVKKYLPDTTSQPDEQSDEEVSLVKPKKLNKKARKRLLGLPVSPISKKKVATKSAISKSSAIKSAIGKSSATRSVVGKSSALKSVPGKTSVIQSTTHAKAAWTQPVSKPVTAKETVSTKRKRKPIKKKSPLAPSKGSIAKLVALERQNIDLDFLKGGIQTKEIRELIKIDSKIKRAHKIAARKAAKEARILSSKRSTAERPKKPTKRPAKRKSLPESRFNVTDANIGKKRLRASALAFAESRQENSEPVSNPRVEGFCGEISDLLD